MMQHQLFNLTYDGLETEADVETQERAQFAMRRGDPVSKAFAAAPDYDRAEDPTDAAAAAELERDALQESVDPDTIHREAEETLERRRQRSNAPTGLPRGARKSGGGGGGVEITAPAEENALSNEMRPGETSEDVLSRTSLVWQKRFESARLLKERVYVHTDGTEERQAAYRAYREERLKSCFGALLDTSNDKLMSTSMRTSRDWYQALKAQFVLVPTNYANLTYFGNVMAAVATDFEAIANPGQNFQSMLITRITCLAAPQFNTKQSLYTLLVGDASVGKSYVQEKNADALPPGWVVRIAHMTALALTNDENEDFLVLMIEEAPHTMTQETAERTGSDGGASFLKTLLTNKICVVRTNNYEKGQRKRSVHVTSKMCTGVFATNSQIVTTSPLLKRYLVVKPSADPNIMHKINTLDSTALRPEQENALLRQRIIAHLVQWTELMIGMGALRAPNMDVFAVIWSRLCEEMHLQGHTMIDAKSVIQVQLVVRTLVVMRAVCEAVLSEQAFELCVDARTGARKKFTDNYLTHFANIEAAMVAQEPEIYFGISLCSGIFGDDTEAKMIEAAKKLLGVRFDGDQVLFDDSKPPPKCAPSSTAVVNDQLVVEQHDHYVELTGTERGLDRLALTLANKCAEKPSFNNAKRALLAMATHTILHEPMEMVHTAGAGGGGASGFRLVPAPNPRNIVLKSVILLQVTVSDDFEARVQEARQARPLRAVPLGSAKTNESKRIYVCVPALRKYVSQEEAMKRAIERLQHVATTQARHLLAMPLVRPRHDFSSVEHRFYGLFDFVDFKPNPNNVLFHQSFHNLLPLQITDLSTESLLHCGDLELNKLTPTQFAARRAAVENRARALESTVSYVSTQIDMPSFMAHRAACGAVTDDADMQHWSNLTEVNLSYREDFPTVFPGARRFTYPDTLLPLRQKQLKEIDIKDKALSHEKRTAALQTFISVTMSGAQIITPPSHFTILKEYKERGMDGVRGMFVAQRSTPRSAPTLDARSKALVAANAEVRANWALLSTILTNYANPIATANAVARFAGLGMAYVDNNNNNAMSTDGGGGVDPSQRTISLTQFDAPDRASLHVPSTTDRLRKKRSELEAESGLGALDKRPRLSTLFDDDSSNVGGGGGAAAAPAAPLATAERSEKIMRRMRLAEEVRDGAHAAMPAFVVPNSISLLNEAMVEARRAEELRSATAAFTRDERGSGATTTATNSTSSTTTAADVRFHNEGVDDEESFVDAGGRVVNFSDYACYRDY